MAKLTRSKPSIPIVVLFLGMLIMVVGTAWFRESVLNKDRLRFENATEDAVKTIENSLERYVLLLYSVRGLMHMGDPLTREEFQHYVESMDLPQNYAGVQGIGFSAYVKPEDREALQERMKDEGVENFSIWPEYERKEHHAIIFVEPQDRRNNVAIGYDMFTDEVRREAMVKARDSGVAALSGKVTLVQEIDEDKQAGFLLYLPVYEGRETPHSLADRRLKLKGFAYCAFRAKDFLSPMRIGGQTVPMGFVVYDGGERKPEHLLYASHPGVNEHEARFATIDYVAVARRTWAVAFHSLPEFDETSDLHLVPLAVIAGLMVTAVLVTLSLSQMRSRRAAEEAAARLRESQKKLAEETREARRLRSEAETANRLKDQFLATVSHELRTPLNAILGWSDLLLDDPDVGGEVRHGLEVIGRNVRAQNQLVEDLLDVSRIISGRLRLDLRETDVREVVESSVESARPAAEARDIELKEHYGSSLPSILADPARLQQIVWNLLSNAVKFSEKGGVVELHADADGAKVTIEVTDHGQGIAPDFLPYIFNPFRQADASISRKHSGLGLGLSIVRHLVEMHGGTIEVQSDGIGTGASFRVELPVRREQRSADSVSRPTVAVQGETSDFEAPDGGLDGLRVLVVDDEPDARELLRSLLERHGAEVLAAGSADEALRLFSWGQPDVIVSDIAMPEKNGYQLIRELRQMETQPLTPTPAIALTAFASERDRLAARDAGFAVHLQKPVKADELLAAILQIIERWQGSDSI